LWPGVVPFDWSEGAPSPVLDELVQGPAAALTAVALVAGGRARASGWAAHAAVALAERWHGSRRVVLVDFDLELPSLHDAAGIPNDEGTADVAEYGVSLSRVRRRVDGYDMVTAGLYAPDPEAALRSETWGSVLAEIATQRATLLAFVPADAAGADAVVRRAGAVIVLAHPGEADSVVESLPSPYAVLAVLTPREAAAAAQPAIADGHEPAHPAASRKDEPAGVAASWDEDADEPLMIAAAADEIVNAPLVEQASAPLTAQASAPLAEQGTAPRGDQAGAPPGQPPGTPRVSDSDFERIRLPTDRVGRDALIADLRERQRAARLAPPAEQLPPQAAATADAVTAEASRPVLVPAAESEHAREMRVETSADDMSLETLDPEVVRDESRGWGPKRPSRVRRPMIWTVSIVLVVSLLAGAWRYLAGRLGWGDTGAAVPAAAIPEEPAADVPEVQDQELPYSVALEAHTDLARAFGRLQALDTERGLSFYIAPLERDGTLYYHIMAGPVQDSAGAVELRDTLLARRIKTAATPTDVRHSPLAFLIGDYGTRDVAQQAMSELQRLDVPSYMIFADAADGYPLYRVFVGAFTSPAEADVTRQLLRAAGVQDSLVTRTGSTSP
jgi:hypothetical protein